MNQASHHPCIVRLTDDAIADLNRLRKKDPNIVRAVFKKMLLLESSPYAGEPLVGALIGFRKLVVGDRDWRIVWRISQDATGTTIIDVSEIWAVGARADEEVYKELASRVDLIGDKPALRPLAEAIKSMGRLFESIEASPEPESSSQLPEWMKSALQDQLHMSPSEISQLTEAEAQQKLMAHWSGQQEH